MRCSSCREFIDLGSAKFCPQCGSAVESPADDPMIGLVVGGRYRVTELIAEGGMGRVYAAEQAMGTSVRKVALKLLVGDDAGRENDTQRFARECSTVAELEHPNTIRFYDYGSTDDGDLYIAMEFLAGHSLAKLIRDEGPLPPERVDRIVGQICGSLDEAHGRGIVHRDLKPDNVVLTSPGGQSDFVKVLDFGIAKRTGGRDPRLTPLGVVLGSPPYMSPEQFTLQDVDPRSDIYSLAVVAYEMLTGRLPFVAVDPLEWAKLHLSAEPRPLEEAGVYVPPPMREAILRALSKRPSERPSTMRAFYGEFSLGSGTLPPGRPISVPPGRSLSPGPKLSEPPPGFALAAPAAPRLDHLRRPNGSSAPPLDEDSSVPPTVREPPAEVGASGVGDRAAAQAVRARGGTLVMGDSGARGASSAPPPAHGAAGLRASSVLEAPPPTVRDSDALRSAGGAGARSRRLVLGAVVGALVAVAAVAGLLWWQQEHMTGGGRGRDADESSDKRRRPAAPPIVVDDPFPHAPGAPLTPSASASAKPRGPCDTAIYAAVAGQCDQARRSQARCVASDPHHAQATRTVEGLCPAPTPPGSPTPAP